MYLGVLVSKIIYFLKHELKEHRRFLNIFVVSTLATYHLSSLSNAWAIGTLRFDIKFFGMSKCPLFVDF